MLQINQLRIHHLHNISHLAPLTTNKYAISIFPHLYQGVKRESFTRPADHLRLLAGLADWLVDRQIIYYLKLPSGITI